ncbi:hypothetical protein HMPREF1475_00886 [Hoylesella oralis HGA0225]|nr:hypothetical protein HMPREF1475_00886 [Hoylesella oralis HGA0225]ETD19583.1 hypothetical protein HMPREF1199_00953 [Hoylesella oralis CC98A]
MKKCEKIRRVFSKNESIILSLQRNYLGNFGIL